MTERKAERKNGREEKGRRTRKKKKYTKAERREEGTAKGEEGS